jgi:deazaflavin-dependent oxidoreductase (nitroreductase family)
MSQSTTGTAPQSVGERERFSSRGRTWMLILRGRWGLKLDKLILRWTGFSVVTWQYAKAGGRPYTPTLLLTTIGARTGELRTAGLPYFRVEDTLVVCGSNGGGPEDPGWAHNIRADGNCWVRVNRRLLPARAHVATGEERARLFERLSPVHGMLQAYQAAASRHGRDVPLVVIRPRRPRA